MAQAVEEMTNTADVLFPCQVADHKTILAVHISVLDSKVKTSSFCVAELLRQQ